MGTEYSQGRDVQRILGQLQDINTEAALRSAHRKGRLDELLVALNTTYSMRTKSNAYFNRGTTIPSSRVYNLVTENPATLIDIKEAIEADVTGTVTIVTCYLGPITPRHHVINHLIDTYGLDIRTGIMEVPVQYYEPETHYKCSWWGKVDSVTDTDYVTTVIVTRVLDAEEGTLGGFRYNLSIPKPVDVFRQCYQVTYTLAGSSDIHIWTYYLDTHVHPELDDDVPTPPDSTMYPLVRLAYGRTLVADVPSTAEYLNSSSLCKTLGLDFGSLAGDIKENVESFLNDDAYNKVYAHLGFYVNLGISMTDGKLDDLGQSTTAYIMKFLGPHVGTPHERYKGKYRINLGTDNYEQYLEYDALWYETGTGRFAKVGEYAITKVRIKGGYEFAYKFTFIHQLTETTYEKILITELDLITQARESGNNKWYSARTSNNSDTYEMYIPVDKTIVMQLPFKWREMFLHKSLCITSAWATERETEWYENPLINFAILFVAIVLALPTGGQSLSWGSALVATLKFVAVSYILKKVSIYLIRKFGVEAVYIVAILSMALGKSGVTGAKYFMGLGIDLWNGAQLGIQQMLRDLEHEYRNFITESEKLQKELDDAVKAADVDPVVDPLELVGYIGDMYLEPRDEFLYKHRTSNLGTLVLEYPSRYVQDTLILPNVDQVIKYSEV